MTTNNPQGVPLTQYMAGQVDNPTLPQNTQFAPVLLPTDAATLQQTGQLMNVNTPGVQMPTTGTNIPTPQVAPAPTLTATQGTAQTVTAANALGQINPNQGQYQATMVSGQTPQGTAEQGTVNPMATVQGQLANLYAQSQPGMIPEWAKGAVTAANEVAAARLVGASSIGVAAIAAAIQQSALPIAAKDASTYFQMDLTNLSNRQQMSLENLRLQQQSLLSDQAADNASKQFNASSSAQIQQFMATLVSNIDTQNADRFQAMSQFNIGQTNQAAFQNVANQITVDQFNANQQAAIDQFNANQRFAREQFNSQAAFAIEQSNVLWRREINTQNTAAINAANQTNVQNRFNISQVAQNNLWQQWRDEASWMFQASEREKDRQFNAAMAANNRAFNSRDTGLNWASAAGSFAAGLLV